MGQIRDHPFGSSQFTDDADSCVTALAQHAAHSISSVAVINASWFACSTDWTNTALIGNHSIDIFLRNSISYLSRVGSCPSVKSVFGFFSAFFVALFTFTHNTALLASAIECVKYFPLGTFRAFLFSVYYDSWKMLREICKIISKPSVVVVLSSGKATAAFT